MAEGQNSIADDILRNGFERWQRLEGEKQAISDDLKELFAELKSQGFDSKALRASFRKVAKAGDMAVEEHNALVELYVDSLMGPRPSEVGTEDATHRRAAREQAEQKPDALSQLRADPDLHIVDASNLKNKSEPQPTKAAGQARGDAAFLSDQLVTSLPGAEGAEDRDQFTEPQPSPEAGSDLTNSQALNGQVATHSDIGNPISTEARDVTGHVAATAPDQGLADQHDADNRNPGGENVDAPDVPATPTTEHASGKSVGASASAAPVKYAAPGIVTYENHPPEGVERSAISFAFANMGQDGALIQDELANGRAQPIVKQGKVILDGWARYMTARTMTELDGSPLTYAVVQYDGTDPLIDIIRLNVEGRMLNEQQKRVIAQTLTRQHPNRKDDIYRAFELWMEPV